MTNQFKNVLAFVVLMAGESVLDKSPQYIMEKFARYTDASPRGGDYWQWGLDAGNTAIFEGYLKRWESS